MEQKPRAVKNVTARALITLMAQKLAVDAQDAADVQDAADAQVVAATDSLRAPSSMVAPIFSSTLHS